MNFAFKIGLKNRKGFLSSFIEASRPVPAWACFSFLLSAGPPHSLPCGFAFSFPQRPSKAAGSAPRAAPRLCPANTPSPPVRPSSFPCRVRLEHDRAVTTSPVTCLSRHPTPLKYQSRSRRSPYPILEGSRSCPCPTSAPP